MRRLKVVAYYLNETRRGDPGNKVGLLRDELGFTRPEMLRRALIRHAQTHDAVFSHDNGFADIYAVVGPLTGPNGKTIDRFLSVWALEYGSQTPHNVTVAIQKKRGA